MNKNQMHQQEDVMFKYHANQGQYLANQPKNSQFLQIKEDTGSTILETIDTTPKTLVAVPKSPSNKKRSIAPLLSNNSFYMCQYTNCKKVFNNKDSLYMHNKNFHLEEILDISKSYNVLKRNKINVKDFVWINKASNKFCAKENKDREDSLSNCSSPKNIACESMALDKRSWLT